MININDVLSKFIVEGLGIILQQEGFDIKRKSMFIRKVGKCKQELNVLFREINGQEAGYIQVFVAFRFDELERLTAELKGGKLRKDWPTVSINIGNLKKEREFIEWPLNEKTDVNSLSTQILGYINEYAYPFWQQFSSIQGIIKGYKDQDSSLILNGNSYRWKMAAAYWVDGEIENARQVLEKWEQGKPSEEILNQALKRLTQ
ncbi:hypothetical protein [Clostridium estertheticum]|uniref:hypothetical protein n=1 Tax=Clostridium estertheticum TaxID=238834 RepID=UPI001CF1CC17|nr:hypothetical protein [Clostridium estertheticum]MCB2362492.1 hypothetical protein [Clostridium estertheticum]